MQTTTTFDLDQALDRWRHSMLSTNALRAEDLAELEEHLRDAVNDLIARGLTPEESFFIASRRLGAGPTIASEYAKVNKWPIWRFRIVWMLLGMVGYQVLGGLIGMGSGVTIMAGYRLGYESSTLLLAVTGYLVGLGLGVFAIWLVKASVIDRRERGRHLKTWLLAHPLWTTALGIIFLVLTEGMRYVFRFWIVRGSTGVNLGRIMAANYLANLINTTLFYLILPIVLITLVIRHLKMTSS